jgi:hypothetical protein
MMGLTLLFEVLPYFQELVRGLRYAGAPQRPEGSHGKPTAS